MPALATEIDEVLQRAARLAARYLERHADPAEPVLRCLPPEELARRIRLELPEEGQPLAALLADAEATLRYSARTGHPRFFNQLFSGYDPGAILGEWISALLDTSMYTYEVAPVATLVERALMERMAALAGLEGGEGILTPGGSISNLMAVLAARDRAAPGCRERGVPPGKRFTLFVSAEAHYSLKRAADIAGLGTQAVVEVPVDRVGRMVPAELEKAVERAREFSGTPFFVAATSGTTVPGAFDPVAPIAEIAARHGMWLHVDGSYGGSVLFSQRHRKLLEGLEAADSFAWNPHKLLGVPLACAALILKEPGRLRKTFSMHADYLFHEGAGAELDLGDHTLQCGRKSTPSSCGSPGAPTATAATATASTISSGWRVSSAHACWSWRVSAWPGSRRPRTSASTTCRSPCGTCRRGRSAGAPSALSPSPCGAACWKPGSS